MLQATAVQELRQLSMELLPLIQVVVGAVLLVERLEQAVLEAAAQGKITTLLEPQGQLTRVEVVEVAGIHLLVA
jgi:flagellar biogenesis protein FliO